MEAAKDNTAVVMKRQIRNDQHEREFELKGLNVHSARTKWKE
jgi:hypothetical protein